MSVLFEEAQESLKGKSVIRTAPCKVLIGEQQTEVTKGGCVFRFSLSIWFLKYIIMIKEINKFFVQIGLFFFI